MKLTLFRLLLASLHFFCLRISHDTVTNDGTNWDVPSVVSCSQLRFFLMVIIITPISLFKGCQQEEGTMLCIRNIEENRDCRFEEMWYLKNDGSISYHYDKGSNGH